MPATAPANSTPGRAADERLASHLKQAAEGSLTVYGETTRKVRHVNVGSGEAFEIHYLESDDEIHEAFFIVGERRLQLDQREIGLLSNQF